MTRNGTTKVVGFDPWPLIAIAASVALWVVVWKTVKG